MTPHDLFDPFVYYHTAASTLYTLRIVRLCVLLEIDRVFGCIMFASSLDTSPYKEEVVSFRDMWALAVYIYPSRLKDAFFMKIYFLLNVTGTRIL